jgi:hypothetical protein
MGVLLFARRQLQLLSQAVSGSSWCGGAELPSPSPFFLLLLLSSSFLVADRGKGKPRCGRWENGWDLVSGYSQLVKPQ